MSRGFAMIVYSTALNQLGKLSGISWHSWCYEVTVTIMNVLYCTVRTCQFLTVSRIFTLLCVCVCLFRRKYLEDESENKRGVRPDMSSWLLVIAKKIPTQKNGSDCGVFMCTVSVYHNYSGKEWRGFLFAAWQICVWNTKFKLQMAPTCARMCTVWLPPSLPPSPVSPSQYAPYLCIYCCVPVADPGEVLWVLQNPPPELSLVGRTKTLYTVSKARDYSAVY